MRQGKFFAFAVGLGLVIAAGVDGQPPFGGKGFKGPFDKKGFKGQPGSERMLDEINVEGDKKAKARDILRAHDDKMRKIVADERKALLAQIKEVLPAEEFAKFQGVLESVPLISTVPAGARGVQIDDLVQHLMTFDKNGDGKIAKDELPERMHGLFEQADANKDGVLDPEELRRLAARSERPPGPPGAPGGFPPPPFPPPPKGPGN